MTDGALEGRSKISITRHSMARYLLLVAVFSGLWAGQTMADTQRYKVLLGHRELGTLQFDGKGSNATLLMTIDNTPFGLEDGTFEAVTRAKNGAVNYLGKSRGSDPRTIEIIRKADIVTAVTVTPQSEMTEMSDARKVPAGVISPTEFFETLANGGTCPSPIAMYDGRRVIQMATTSTTENGDSVICDMSYRIIAGPGYIAPLYIKSLSVQLSYAARRLTRFSISGGGFVVNLIRQ